jgi:hypothetical protein
MGARGQAWDKTWILLLIKREGLEVGQHSNRDLMAADVYGNVK